MALEDAFWPKALEALAASLLIFSNAWALSFSVQEFGDARIASGPFTANGPAVLPSGFRRCGG